MSVVRTSIGLSVLSLVVSALSFANQLIIAHHFGAGHDLDLYLLAVSAPLLVTGLFGGLFTFGMVPALVRAEHDADTAGVARSFFLAFAALGLAIAVIGASGAGPMLQLIGHAEDEAFARARSIARFGWAAAGCSVLLGYLGALQNTRGRFFSPVIASALPYVAMMGGTVWLGASQGPAVLAWGLVAGTAAATMLLLSSSAGELLAPARGRNSPRHVRDFLASAPTILLASLGFAAYPMIDAYWAPSIGEANLSYLGYCQRIVIAVGVILAAGPAAVLQPRFASAMVERRVDDFRRDLAKSLRLVLAVCGPVILGGSLIAPALVRAVFERGAFTPEDTAAVATLLPWMLTGSVAMVGVVMLFKALFASRDVRGALIVGVIGPVVYAVAAGLLREPMGLAGFGAAYLVSWSAAFVFALHRAWAGPGALRAVLGDIQFGRGLAVGLAGVALATVVGGQLLLSPLPATWWGLVTRIAAVSVVTGAVYLVSTTRIAPLAEVRLIIDAVFRSAGAAEPNTAIAPGVPSWYLPVKRVVDVLAAAVTLVVLAPLLALIAAAVALSSGLPVIFRQERLGLASRRFQILKFRTMRVNAPDVRNSDGTTFNATDDPRVTPLGRFLRQSSLDELPQLWNVLIGDMSLVGGRPDLPEADQRYSATDRVKLDVRPGLTSFAIIHGRNNVPLARRWELDAWYAANLSLALDLRIVAQTILIVLTGAGVVRNAENPESTERTDLK